MTRQSAKDVERGHALEAIRLLGLQLQGATGASDLVLARVRPVEPWPSTEKSRAWALRRVADLTRDHRLAELLAAEATRYAAERWSRLRVDLHEPAPHARKMGIH